MKANRSIHSATGHQYGSTGTAQSAQVVITIFKSISSNSKTKTSATHGELKKVSKSVFQWELRGPVTPVCGPFLFMDNSRLLSLELWPVLARNLHCMVLRHFVFVVGPLEEATLPQERGQPGGVQTEEKREKREGG